MCVLLHLRKSYKRISFLFFEIAERKYWNMQLSLNTDRDCIAQPKLQTVLQHNRHIIPVGQNESNIDSLQWGRRHHGLGTALSKLSIPSQGINGTPWFVHGPATPAMSKLSVPPTGQMGQSTWVVNANYQESPRAAPCCQWEKPKTVQRTSGGKRFSTDCTVPCCFWGTHVVTVQSYSPSGTTLFSP